MRHLLATLTFLSCAFGAAAQLRVSDVLLADDGTLFTIDSVATSTLDESDGTRLETKSSVVLRLRSSRGDVTSEAFVPGSLTGGAHIEPSLAFDQADSRLYVFWERIPNLASSELLFASCKDGVWTETREFGEGGLWTVRMNLKVAFTHSVTRVAGAEATAAVPATIAHAVWWEQNGADESARYAMLELEHGSVTSVQQRALSELLPSAHLALAALPDGCDRDVYRKPFVFALPAGDSVDVVYADVTTGQTTVGTVRPIESEQNGGVIRIPTGVTRSSTGAPMVRNRSTEAYSLSAVQSSNGNLAIFTTSDSEVVYSILRRGTWSPANRLKLNASVTLDVGLEAIRRLVFRE